MNKNEYWANVNEVYARYADQGINRWRYGQTAFNVLHMNYPDAANMLRGTAIDPFNLADDAINQGCVAWSEFCMWINSVLPDVDPLAEFEQRWEDEGGLTY